MNSPKTPGSREIGSLRRGEEYQIQVATCVAGLFIGPQHSQTVFGLFSPQNRDLVATVTTRRDRAGTLQTASQDFVAFNLTKSVAKAAQLTQTGARYE